MALEYLDRQFKAVNDIYMSFSWQLLANTETLVDCVKDEEERREIAKMAEALLKKPFRRQMGKLKMAALLLTEIKTKLEAMKP